MSQSQRIALIRADQHPELTTLIDSVKAQRGGSFLNLYAALANSPSICAGWLALFTSIRQHSMVPSHLRELAMLRVAVLNRAEYEFVAHTPFALAAGVSQAQIDGLRERPVPDRLYAPVETAVLDYTDQMTCRIQVEDDCMARLKAEFSEQVLLELTVTIAGYNMVSRVLEALQIPHEAAP